MCERERERARERERKREKERKSERQTDRQAGRQTVRQTDRQTERASERARARARERAREREARSKGSTLSLLNDRFHAFGTDCKHTCVNLERDAYRLPACRGVHVRETHYLVYR